jgi:hypothetical protein
MSSQLTKKKKRKNQRKEKEYINTFHSNLYYCLDEEKELRNVGCEGELAVEHIPQNVEGVELLNVEC